MLYYTGVGSRKTPKEILFIMKSFAIKAAEKGFILRSGGAVGADNAFERGCYSVKGIRNIYYADHCTPKAMIIASKFHPTWNKCSVYAKMLHGRNALQVLGDDLIIPSKFLICWTPDGCMSHNERTIKTGGTGTAISIAEYYNVPIYNLKNESCMKIIDSLLIV